MVANKQIRVLCIDDHPLVREGIARRLNREPDIKVVGMAGTGEAGLEMFRRLLPDVVLMDLQLPRMSGLQAIQAMRHEHGAARIVVLTMYQGDEDIYRALKAGAASYLLKDTLSSDLVSIVREVYRGGHPLPGPVASLLAVRVNQSALSAREIDVLKLVAQGKRNKEIALELNVSLDTVQTHLKRLFVKLGVKDRTAAVTVALTRGIIHL